MKKKAVFILFYDRPSPRQILIARAVEKIGYEPVFIAWNRKGADEPRQTSPIDGRAVRWVNVKAPTWSAKLLFAIHAYYCGVLKEFKGLDGVELVFLTHLAILPLALFIRGPKKIYESAELYAFGMSLYFGPLAPLVRGIISLMEDWLTKAVDGVTVVDAKDGALEKRFAHSNGNVHVLWNTTSIADDPAKEHVKTLGADFYKGRRVISFVGGLMKEKGLRVALRSAAIVAKRYPDILFVFIGPMKENREEILSLVESLGVKEDTRFFDFMPYTEMLAHVKNASVGLALFQRTMHYEQISSGGARRYFTYMQAGVPVIGPSFSEAGRIVMEADCGLLVDTSDPEAVAQAIIKLLDNPATARKLGENGRKAFETRYNWETEEPRLIAFLDKILGAR